MNKNSQVQTTITSLEVAEMIGKEHNKLLRDIRGYIEQLSLSNIGQSEFFTESKYMNERGKEYPCFNVTKKGCEFIANKLTGVKGTAFTARYINRFHEMEDDIRQIKRLSPEEIMRIQLNMIDNHEDRITNLENNMTIDYGQQRVLEDTVNKTVIDALGGKGSNAYVGIGRKVFAECNRDLKHYFNVNARNNVPKKRFDEAVEYARNWKPCTNTMMMIADCNAQINL